MNYKEQEEQTLVISFLTLRRTVGVLGIIYPFLLALGAIVFYGEIGFKSSLSAYYYTGMRNVLVGVLCAVGLFLFAYSGYSIKDKIAGKLGCVFAIGLALFPEEPKPPTPEFNNIIGVLHLICAASLFAIFAYYSLALFTRSNSHKSKQSKAKRRRNLVYRICGYTIIGAIVTIAVYKTFFDEIEVLQKFHPIFWLETIALLAFGTSWITKGQVIWRDVVEEE